LPFFCLPFALSTLGIAIKGAASFSFPKENHSLSASKFQDLRADRDRAERKKQNKQSYDRCNTQQLEGETQDKSERVTSVTRVTKLVPARAYKELTESKSRRKASILIHIFSTKFPALLNMS
jgi:hypothetical protein